MSDPTSSAELRCRRPHVMSTRWFSHRLGILAGCVLTGCVAHVSYVPVDVPPGSLSDLDAVVYLVGDGGAATAGREAVLSHLRSDLERRVRDDPDASAVVAFLGDNIYNVGAREAFKAEDLAQLTAQVDAIRGIPGTQAVFLPGNHDWAKGAGDQPAQEAIRLQQSWLTEIAPDSIARFLPTDGCPGPSPMHIGGDVHTLFIDTEWLLRQPDDECGSAADFYEELQARLEELAGQRVLLAAHHPVVSGGPHGGNTEPLQRGPFIQYLAVKSGVIVQDIASGRYTDMIRSIYGAIEASGTRPLAFVAGHDHSLQVIGLNDPMAPYFQLLSGSASKTSPVGRIEGTRYAAEAYGYMRLDFSPSATHLVVFAQTTPGEDVRAVFACSLDPNEPRSCPEAQLVGSGS